MHCLDCLYCQYKSKYSDKLNELEDAMRKETSPRTYNETSVSYKMLGKKIPVSEQWDEVVFSYLLFRQIPGRSKLFENR